MASMEKWYKLLFIATDDDGGVTAQVSTSSDSPWFSGHFPGDPVLPGIAQLDMVVECIEQATGKRLLVQGLSRVKFKKLIRPGDVLDIQATVGKSEKSFNFQIINNDRPVCSGKLELLRRKEQ